MGPVSLSLNGYGEGGYGRVRKVFDPFRATWVARKELKQFLSGDDRTRFRQEIQLLKTLDHPNIVRILDAYPDANPPAYTMVFAENGPLVKHIRNLIVELKFRISFQVMSALSYCHARGVFHRDGKPDNILLDADWNVQLADFGVGRILGRSLGLTVQPLGTEGYVPPEVLEGRRGDAAGDIYSFGIVLNQVWCDGRWPNSNCPPSNVVGGLSGSMDRLIVNMTGKDPSARPSAASCRDVITKAFADFNHQLRMAGLPELQIELEASTSPGEVAALAGGGAALGAALGSLVDKRNGAGPGAALGALAGFLYGILK